MKRLFLFPILCLMPAAQAMDYVKCEAMNKASERIRGSMEKALRKVSAECYSAKLDACEYQRETFGYSSTMTERCNESWEAANSKEWDEKKEAVLVLYSERLAKVQMDYDAEGCY